jgi:TetR/AcrR family tetracycline transcriptional repressor
LRLARAGDLRTLTMKRLGDELGVTAMAMYRHFPNKGEVIEGILDRFVREADVTGHGVDPADWRAWATQTALRQYRALSSTPGVIPFVATSSAWQFGAAARSTMDEALGVLEAAGFSKPAALEVQMNALAMAIGWATLGATPSGATSGTAAIDPVGVFERGLAEYLGSLAP